MHLLKLSSSAAASSSCMVSGSQSLQHSRYGEQNSYLAKNLCTTHQQQQQQQQQQQKKQG
jgi:hypothetical protein